MKKYRWILFSLLLCFCFLTPVHGDNTNYVKDNYGLLTASEVTSLNTKAAAVSKKYNVGVYIRIEPSYSGYSSIEKYDESLYETEQLGYGTGSERECVLLILTMDDRSYDIMAHGTTANKAFTDYGKNALAEKVVSGLKQKNYSGAFETFIKGCDSYLDAEAQGTPVDTSNADPQAHAEMMRNIKYGVTFGGAPLIALIVCLIIKSKNKTSRINLDAESYVPKGGMHLTGQQDIFLYRTQTVTHINRDHGGGGGGTSINGGGFSHSSGHF
jgi:uncharacterized membrane protein YgcG